MIGALLIGVVAGFVLAIPPGPIGIAVVKQGVERRFRDGIELAMGAALMDSVYALAAAFASSSLMSALRDVLRARPWIPLVFQITCVAALLLLGVHYLRQARGASEGVALESAREVRARRLGITQPFFIGVIMAMTNVATPTFIPSMIFLSSFLDGAGWLPPQPASRALYAVGFGVGTLAWFLSVLRALHAVHDKLTPQVSARIQKISGGAFIACALILAIRVVVAAR